LVGIRTSSSSLLWPEDHLIKRKTDLRFHTKKSSFLIPHESQNTSRTHTMYIPVCLVTFLALLSIPPDVHAHGYLKSPRSRNWVARQQNLEWCPHCLNRKGNTETCGRSDTWNYNNARSAPRIEATYNCGQTIDVDVTLTAHHKGHFVLKACPISPGGVATQACFDANKLRFVSGEGANFDPNYPERAYIPPAPPGTQLSNGAGVNGYEWNYRYRFQLPSRMSGDLVLLQWHYVTANSCLPPGYNAYQFPSGWHPGNLATCGPLPADGNGFPEQFWNCAEIRIVNNCGSGPTPTPPPPAPTPPTTTGSVGYCNWGPLGTGASSTCDGLVQGGTWCNANQGQCESGCGGKWCIPLVGYCNWGPLGTAASSTCDGQVQGGTWCNANQSQCQTGCGGKWCYK
jgi:hypothetical protein